MLCPKGRVLRPSSEEMLPCHRRGVRDLEPRKLQDLSCRRVEPAPAARGRRGTYVGKTLGKSLLTRRETNHNISFSGFPGCGKAPHKNAHPR